MNNDYEMPAMNLNLELVSEPYSKTLKLILYLLKNEKVYSPMPFLILI